MRNGLRATIIGNPKSHNHNMVVNNMIRMCAADWTTELFSLEIKRNLSYVAIHVKRNMEI